MSSEPGPQSRSTGEAALVVSFAVFTSFYLYQSFFLERTLISDYVGPAAFPQLVAGAALLLCVIYFVQRLRRRGDASEKGEDKSDVEGARTSLLTLVPIVMYVLLLEPIGFLFSTAAFVFVAMLFFGQRLIKAAVYAVTISIAFFVLFYYALLSHIPMGTFIATGDVFPFLVQLRRAIEG